MKNLFLKYALSQLFGVAVEGEIANALGCLAKRDYAGFYAALPPDVQAGIIAFVLSKTTGKLL